MKAKKSSIYRFHSIALALIFCAAIYAPLFIGILQEGKKVSQTEKRVLAKLPALPGTMKEIAAYPKALDTFYSDHFGLREVFSNMYFRIHNKIETSSPSSDVTYGQDGWMFLGSIKKGYTRYNDPMGDVMNINLFTNEELERFARNMLAIKDWLSKQGIGYVFVIAPNKHTIYFEKLPKYIKKQNKESATDQIVRYLREHTDVVVVDLREPLLKEKERRQVYQKTDTHWNHYGANVAQFEIMKEIGRLFPGRISPQLLKPSEFKITSTGGGDLAVMAMKEGITEEYPRPSFENACNPVKDPPDADEAKDGFSMICNSRGLNVLIFRDSFFDALQPYFSRKFGRSTYIWDRISGSTLMKYVEREKPDLVIEEVVERSFPYIPKGIGQLPSPL